MEQSDLQFKDSLRKELITYKIYAELLENKDYGKLKELLQANIDRINASLQD